MAHKTIKIEGPQIRGFQFDRSTIDQENRTVELSFSSETRDVLRWFGIEVLGHSPGECDLSRLNSAGPLLMDHNFRDQIGVIEKSWIDETTRKGRALVRFSKSTRGEEILQDVLDGIRVNVSVTYDVSRYALEEEGKDGNPDVYRAVSWMPLEISILSVPADTSVGVGRSREVQAAREIDVVNTISDNERSKNTMERCAICGKEMSNGVCPDARAHVSPPAGIQVNETDVRARERARIREITATGERFKDSAGVAELARQFVENGGSVEAFQAAVLAKIGEGSRSPGFPEPVNLQFNEREQNEYSVVRAVNMAAGLMDFTGIEFDIHQEISRKLGGRNTKGIFIPMQLRAYQGSRAPLTTSTSAPGAGYSVATEVRDMIEMLRAKMLVRAMGATVLSGLTSSVAFPRQTGTTSLSWTGENPGSDTGESNATMDQVTLTPKTAQATTAYSKQLLQQSSLDIENFVRGDLTATGAQGLDNAAINGTGGSNQPRGILATSGIGSVAGGDNGALPTWQNIVALEAAVATANADVGSLGYLSTTKARGILKSTPKFTGTGTPIWEKGSNGFDEMNGYKAGATTQVPSNLVKGTSGAVCSGIIFGNWADLLIGEFGVIEIIADPYAKKKQGLIEVTEILMCDIAARHPASFAAMLDALTTGF